jgi:hypothetical protein
MCNAIDAWKIDEVSCGKHAADRIGLVLQVVTFKSQSFLSDLVMSTLPPSAMAVCRPADL